MSDKNVRKLFYDANFSIGKFRGMGKYVNNFIDVLVHNFDCKAIGLLKGNTPAISNNYYSFGFSNYIFWEQISLLAKLKRSSDIMIFPYNTASVLLPKNNQNILFLHDLIFLNDLSTNSLKQKMGKMYRKFIVPKIIGKFKYIITVSQYSKKQIIKAFNIPPENISVIPNSVSFSKKQIKRNVNFEDRENFFFHIGGEPEYKNSKSLLYAFASLPTQLKEKYSLKIIGIRDKKTLSEFQAIANDLKIDEKVFFLPYQTDDEISALYSKAKLFLFPSLHEGFGIPIIEAFKFGCPVISSNQSCLPEVGANGAYYYDPFVANQLADTICKVLNDDNVHSKINLGYEVAESFSQANFRTKVIQWINDYCNKESINFS